MALQILRVDRGKVSAAEQKAEFSLHTTAGEARLAIPVADIGRVMQFFGDLARQSGQDAALPADLYPIELSGLGVQEGLTPDTLLLVAKIGAAALALEIPRSQAADTARNLLLLASEQSAGAKPN